MTIKDIENAISKLPPTKLKTFRAWFYKFENRIWDKKFEQDVKKGKIDTLGEEAVRAFKKGHCKEL